jgi:hypothetical protein
MLICERSADQVRGTILSQQPEVDVEVIVNGRIVESFHLATRSADNGNWEFQREVKPKGTHWVAVRVWERSPQSPGTDRWRYAHSTPMWRDVASEPLRPTKQEAEFLVSRVRNELTRSGELLPPAAIEEYQAALANYEKALREASKKP